MEGRIRILHTADWQLRNSGTIAGKTVMCGDYNQVLIDARQALDLIVDYAMESEIDLIVVAGDVFEYPKPEKEAIKVAVDTVDRLADVAPVVIIRGNPNHDGGGSVGQVSALNVFRNRRNRCEVFVNDDPQSYLIFNQKQNIRIFVLPYPPKSGITALPQYKTLSPEHVNALISGMMVEVIQGFHAWIEKDVLNLFVGHFTVAGGLYSAEQLVPMWDVSVSKDVLDRFDVVCLGHLHLPQPMYSGAIAQGGFGDEKMEPGFRVINWDPDKREVITDLRVLVPHRVYKTVSVEDVMSGNLPEDPGTAIRIKGSSSREGYREYLDLLRKVDHQFVKNSVELIQEARARCENISADMETVKAFEAWLELQEKKGYAKRKDNLLAKVISLEERLREEANA